MQEQHQTQKKLDDSMRKHHQSSAIKRVNFQPAISPHASLNDLISASKTFHQEESLNGSTRIYATRPTSEGPDSLGRPISRRQKSKSTDAAQYSTRSTDNLEPFSFETTPMPWALSEDTPYPVRSLTPRPYTAPYPIAIPSISASNDISITPSITPRNKKHADVFRTSPVSTSSNSSSADESPSVPNNPLAQANQKQPAKYCSALGDIYSNLNAMKAYQAKKLNSQSQGDNNKLRILFINQTSKTLILCWVGFDHKLHHYYKLKPSSGTTILEGLNSSASSTPCLKTQFEGGIHSEHTCLGHCFVIGTCAQSEEEKNGNDANEISVYQDEEEYEEEDEGQHHKCWALCRSKKDLINPANIDKSKFGKIIAAYRPTKLTSQSDDNESRQRSCVHMITITEELAFVPSMLKKNKVSLFQSSEVDASSFLRNMYHLSVTPCKLDETPLDTSEKEYEEIIIGGWRTFCEKGLFPEDHDISSSSVGLLNRMLSMKSPHSVTKSSDDHNDASLKRFRERLERDLVVAAKKLPTSACELLKKSTPVWINRSQMYGPKISPIKGHGCCFHPGRQWLIDNGMSEKKAGGIEIYEAGEYLKSCNLWHGVGGVMLHELAHAFHSKCLKDGYDNKEIIDCYNAAMEEKLYDCVKVHTSKRGVVDERKAYACTNAMEYFAELSVAFLGGVGEDKDLEFNKWFPFNREQIKEHDPRAHSLLKKLWHPYMIWPNEGDC